MKRGSLILVLLLTLFSCDRTKRKDDKVIDKGTMTVADRAMWGDNDLGSNFSLLEGDRIEDRVIVYCTGRSDSVCYAGTFIVPIYSRHMDSTGKYAEYAETAKSNDDFIIARTLHIKDKKQNYWIISKDFSLDNCDKTNCESIIQSNVIGPLDYSHFKTKQIELGINLQFDKD